MIRKYVLIEEVVTVKLFHIKEIPEKESFDKVEALLENEVVASTSLPIASYDMDSKITNTSLIYEKELNSILDRYGDNNFKGN